jgi:DNA-directed RNA polymerase specialized sigma24 family protein
MSGRFSCANSAHCWRRRNAWLAILEPREQDLMTLRHVEDWEYHEIAAARSVPIGTVQWQVFNSKKKLAAHLRQSREPKRRSSSSSAIAEPRPV